MRRHLLADRCHGLALLTLCLVGVDLIIVTTGRDLGAGLQPAYLLLALAWLVRLATVAGRPGGHGLRQLGLNRTWLVWSALIGGALLLSAVGLWLAPARLLQHEVWPRFARQVVQATIMAAFVAYPALWTRGPRRWCWTLQLLGWAAAAQLAYALLQGVHVLIGLPGVDALEWLLTSNPAILSGSTWLYLGGYTELPRLRGTMCEPLYLGSYLVGILPLLAWSGRRRLAVLGLVVLLLTWSRAAWFAAGGGLVIWWILCRRAGLPAIGPRPLVITALALLGGLALVTILAGPAAVTWPVARVLQTLDQTDWSNLTRYYSVQAAWRAWLQSPLVGVGWGQFPYHFYALVDLPGLESQFTWPVVNSWPLLVLAETGLLGFGVMLAAAGVLWRRTWRALAVETCAQRRGRLAAVAAGCCGTAVHLLLFSQYNLPHLWVLPGLWLAALAACRPGGGQDRRTRQ